MATTDFAVHVEYGSAMRRLALLIGLLLVVLSLVVAGLTVVTVMGARAWVHQPGDTYDRAPEAMSVLRALERERVTFLRTQDWCQAYKDGDSVHANTLTGTCTVTSGPAHTFDAVTRARYDTLAQMAAEMPYAMNYVEITYAADGRMTGAQISLDKGFSRQTLVYDPGYSLDALRATSSPDILAYTAIDPDWYLLLEDWN